MPATNQEEIGSLIERIEYFLTRDPNIVRKLCDEALSKRFQSVVPKDKVLIYRYTGLYYLEADNYETAKTWLFKALELSSYFNLSSIKSKIYVDLGVIHRQIGQSQEALDFYSKALEDCSNQTLPSLYVNIGMLYTKLSQLIIARSFLTRAVEMLNEQKRTNSFVYWKANLSLCGLEIKENPDKPNLEKVKLIRKRCIEIGFFRIVADAYYQEAVCYGKQGLFKKSLEISKEGLAFSKEHNLTRHFNRLYRINKNFDWLEEINSFSAKPEALTLLNSKLFDKDGEIRTQLSELKLINAQINPHFVFNCLSSISGLVANDSKDLAIDGIQNLSKLLRAGLLHSKQKLVTVQNELELIQSYIELELMRIPDLFIWEIQIETEVDLTTIKIPPFVLQPIIENSIKHGFKNSKDNRIILSISEELDFLIFKVNDNGSGLSNNVNEEHLSFGLESISNKIKLLCLNPYGEEPLTINNIIKEDIVVGVETQIKIQKSYD